MLCQTMPPYEPSRVFISYARKGAEPLAQRLQSDLTKQGFYPWLDERRLGGVAVWSAEIEREMVTRQVTLALPRATPAPLTIKPPNYSPTLSRILVGLRATRK